MTHTVWAASMRPATSFSAPGARPRSPVSQGPTRLSMLPSPRRVPRPRPLVGRSQLRLSLGACTTCNGLALRRSRPGFDTIAIDKRLAHQPALGFRQGAGACPRRVGRACAGLRQRMAQATVRRDDLVSVVDRLADSLGILARSDGVQAIWEIGGSSRDRICTLRRCHTARSHATSGRTMRSAGVLICLRCRYSERLSADSRGDIGRFGFPVETTELIVSRL
jgi:hypothetical protein